MADASFTQSCVGDHMISWFQKDASSKRKKPQGNAWDGFKRFWLGEDHGQNAACDPEAALPVGQRPGLHLALIVVGLIATVIAWPYLEDTLAEHLRASSAQRAGQVGSDAGSTVRVELINPPATMSPLLRERVANTVASLAGADPLDQRGLSEAAAALVNSPWVREVRAVRRGSGGRVLVDATFREPVAVVRGRDGYHLIDEQCVRLPGLYLKHQLRYLGLPVITGVGMAPPPQGAVWSGDDLRAGLQLAGLIEGEPYADQVVAYDVSDRDALGRLRLRLLTEAGMVRWGLPPGDERGLEPDSETKRRWLSSVDRRRGSIDAGGRIVDVNGAAVYVYDWASQSQRPVAAVD